MTHRSRAGNPPRPAAAVAPTPREPVLPSRSVSPRATRRAVDTTRWLLPQSILEGGPRRREIRRARAPLPPAGARPTARATGRRGRMSGCSRRDRRSDRRCDRRCDRALVTAAGSLSRGWPAVDERFPLSGARPECPTFARVSMGPDRSCPPTLGRSGLARRLRPTGRDAASGRRRPLPSTERNAGTAHENGTSPLARD